MQAFKLDVDTLEVTLGSFLTLSAVGVRLDTGASADAFLIEFIKSPPA